MIQRLILEGFINGRWICILNNFLEPQISETQLNEFTKELEKELQNRRITEVNIDKVWTALIKLI